MRITRFLCYFYIKNIEDKDTIKRLQFYKNCLDNMSNEQEKGK